MTNFDWVSILEAIPPNAEEPIVKEKFVKPLLEAFGFNSEEAKSGDQNFQQIRAQ